MTGFPRPESLATVEWLGDNLDRPGLRILDVRWRPDGTGRAVHLAGHIPGAVHLDWATDLVNGEETGLFLLAGPEQVAAAMARSGVGNGSTVVLYDDTGSLFASRVWWSLRVYGFDAVRILDGGYRAWTTSGRPISNSSPAPETTVFTPRVQMRQRLTWAELRGLLSSPDVTLLDARAPAEFLGFEGNGRRLGHIPGALNLPVAAMTEAGTQRFRNADELHKLLLKANVTKGRRMVCYDGSGIAAAKLLFILNLLGHEDLALYDGGWAEWGDRLDLPVDR